MIFKRPQIRHKLTLIMLGLSFLVVSLISSIFIIQFDQALKERVLLQLASVVKLKVLQIENEIAELKGSFSQMEAGNWVSKEDFSQIWKIKIASFKQRDTLFLQGIPIMPALYTDTNQIYLKDVTPYTTEGDISLAFIQITGTDSILIGMRKVPQIQAILFERTGLGQTGESYIVGEDFTLRTRSRFYPKRNPTEIASKTPAAKLALSGKSDTDILVDYRGKQVFTAFRKINLENIDWAILTEIDHQEALFPLQKMKFNLLIAVIVSMAFIAFISYQISRLAVSPLETMRSKLNLMSKGQIGNPANIIQRRDEIGDMFNAYNRLVKALNQAVAFADEIGSGNFYAEYEVLSEFDELGKALLQMREQLKDFKRKESQLIKENQRSIINGEENERSRLAKELHDGIGPLLTSLKLKIQSLPLGKESTTDLIEYLDETIQETRRISNNLMPSVLVDFGAGEAIGNLTQQIKKESDLKIRYENYLKTESHIPHQVNIALYRIVQEAMNNILKHAGATEVSLSLTEFEDQVSLFIQDNGKGCQDKDLQKGNGIRNMSERTRLLNGIFTFESDPTGTTIEAEIPLKWRKSEY